ncbi:MAG: addiction module protein [Gemmataceae bacterium]
MTDQTRSGLSDEQRELFTRRLAELDANPDNVLTWEQIKDRIAGRAAAEPQSRQEKPT